MVMAPDYPDCDLGGGANSSLRTPSMLRVDRSNRKTNSDPAKDGHEH